MMIRILACILLALLAFVGPWWLFVPAAILYAVRFDTAYELFMIAFFLEVHYGGGAVPHPFVYLALTAALLLTISFVKPRLALPE